MNLNRIKINQKRGFTIVEVSILLVIFLIVTSLVVPLSLDDTMQAKNASRWRGVQSDFSNIFYSASTFSAPDTDKKLSMDKAFETVIKNDIKSSIDDYKIVYMNGTFPAATYRFSDFYKTYSNAVIAYKFYDNPTNGVYGKIMYDVNGEMGPNVWGKDVFGLNILEDKFEPFCKNESVAVQKKECAKSGTGLCCSNYYLIGGSID